MSVSSVKLDEFSNHQFGGNRQFEEPQSARVTHSFLLPKVEPGPKRRRPETRKTLRSHDFRPGGLLQEMTEPIGGRYFYYGPASL